METVPLDLSLRIFDVLKAEGVSAERIPRMVRLVADFHEFYNDNPHLRPSEIK